MLRMRSVCSSTRMRKSRNWWRVASELCKRVLEGMMRVVWYMNNVEWS
jgi:hypothetical protein